MKRKSTFTKKYPLLEKYITDPIVQENMVANKILENRYNAYSETIALFLFEVEKRFDFESVKKIIIEVIVKLNDETMISLITAYLNSDEATKANPEFISYYNKTANYGEYTIDYLKENGIIVNRNYKEAPIKALDFKYNELKTGKEVFKGINIDTIYPSLNLAQKKFVISLIESGALESFDTLFAKLNINFHTLIDILINKNIDSTILNSEVLLNIEPIYITILICLIIDDKANEAALANIKRLIKLKQYNLLTEIIRDNLLHSLAHIPEEAITDLNVAEVIKLLKKEN